MPKALAAPCLLGLFVPVMAPAAASEPLSFQIVSDTALTEPFHTKTTWRLVITQEPATDDNLGRGDVHFCFVHDGKPSCPELRLPDCDLLNGKPARHESDNCGTDLIYNDVGSPAIFQPKNGAAGPLLVVHAGGNWGGPGFPNGPIIWTYRPGSDTFEQVLVALRSPNTNGEARFVTEGKLAGWVITAEATSHAPYHYHITAYRLQQTNGYEQALAFDGNTRYGDGNPLAVIDSEMPEIERRLNLWKAGDPLPVPERMPATCSGLELRKGVEWCQ